MKLCLFKLFLQQMNQPFSNVCIIHSLTIFTLLTLEAKSNFEIIDMC